MKASFFSELKKRRVYQSAVAYAIVAWGITEILEGVIAGLGWPDWLATLAVILFVTGFPVAMFLAWVYDWTPEGIRRSAPSGPLGWLPIAAAAVFLVAGSGGLFWLINPSGIIRAQQVGVAVLPCRYQGGPDHNYRAAGIAELINDGLAHSAQLFVPAFGSVAAAAANNPLTSQLADQLAVSWLVECRVAEVQGGIRIEASIVDVDTDESSELFRSEVRSLEIVDVLTNLESAVLRHLGLKPDISVPSSDFTTSLAALDEFLLGQDAMRRSTAQGYNQARVHFQNAQRSGEFRLARLREADAMLALLENELPESPAAGAAALRAAGLLLNEVGRGDDAPAGVYAARLRLANLADRLDHDGASESQRLDWVRRAIARRPNYADPYLLYAEFLSNAGRDDEAAEFRALARRWAP